VRYDGTALATADLTRPETRTAPVSEWPGPRVAVMIPCYNEAQTIGKVVDDFRRALPSARIYVFDNNSIDDSAAIAMAHSATVIPVPKQGKGNVVRAMLASVDADLYAMVDGDDTYPAESVHDLIEPVLTGRADMVVGARLQHENRGAFPSLHHLGNVVFCWLVSLIFGSRLHDILSGYRVFNSNLAKHLPIVSGGFDIEAEITIQCLYFDFTIKEVDIPYRPRPDGSVSKLNTFSDGLLILLKIFHLLRAYKPLTFFGGLGLLALGIAFLGDSGVSLAAEQTDAWRAFISLIRNPLVIFGVVFVSTGIIVHTSNYRIKELYSVMLKSGPGIGRGFREYEANGTRHLLPPA
jgi:glycosyltransferase involved in cell wall biosynthesis